MPSRRTAAPSPTGSTPTSVELRDLIAHLLAGVAGGSEAKWRKLIGEVEALPIVFHPRSNWRVAPTGSAGEREAIDKAVVVVRDAHPYVSSPKTENDGKPH
jgi:hypothetical protein